MKTFFRLAASYVLLNLIILDPVYAQSYQNTRKYRVTAYKNGTTQTISVSNIAEVTPMMSFFIPDAFTPNGDGINDTFGITGEAIKTYNMRVFNRWGELLFESSNATRQWDGSFKGEPVPQGVYVYHLTAQANTGERATKKGTVTLVE